MTSPDAYPYKPLERNAPMVQTRRNLPHWRQDGCLYYLTFRLADSLPETLLKEWRQERDTWLALHPEPWSAEEAEQYSRQYQGQTEKWLDAGHGSCALRDPALRAIVSEALHHFDGQRYNLDAYVVMPNHVHVLVAPKESETGVTPVCLNSATPTGKLPVSLSLPSPERDSGILPAVFFQSSEIHSKRMLSKILHSWKSFSTKVINHQRGTVGIFWMDETFDYAVRSEKQRQHFRNYLRENPAKAHLRKGEWTFWERKDEAPVSKRT